MMDREFKPPTSTLWSVLSLLAVLGWALPVQAQSAPALQFTSPTVLRLHPENRLWARDTDMHPIDGQGVLGQRKYYFDALAAQQSAADELTFTVEGQGGEAREYCYEGHCGAVSVAVLAELGHLYLGVDIAEFKNRNDTTNRGKSRNLKSKFEDFAARRVEVAVQGGQQKVYQEVVVAAPASAPDCSDYPEQNEDRFRCYYTREYQPAAFGDPAGTSTLVADLPAQLVQDREQYEVVFAEEFTGSYTPTAEQEDHCDRGLAALDEGKWNHRYKLCRRDPQGAPCEYLEDGHLHMWQGRECVSEMTTQGIFEPRYGYVEASFTVDAARPNYDSGLNSYQNYFIYMGNLRRVGQHLLSTHNLPISSLEDLLTLVPWVEMDLIEYVPHSDYGLSHRYRNWGPFVHHRDVPPMRTNRLERYRTCRADDVGCQDIDRITITVGMEWTPGGYLLLEQVHWRDDKPEIIDKADIDIEAAAWRSNEWSIAGIHRQQIWDSHRDPYFILPDPDDTTFYLEAVGVSHVPSPINLGVWGYYNGGRASEVTIDYIRVFQPRNRYADMEPRYQ